MLEIDVKDVFEGLMEEISIEADTILATAFGLAAEYGEIAERLEENQADNVVAFGRNVICFQKVLALKEHDGEFALDEENKGGKQLLFDAQIQFSVDELQNIKFYLNLSLTGLESDYQSLPHELIESSISNLKQMDINLVNEAAESFREKLGNAEVLRIVESSASVIAGLIEEEYGHGITHRMRELDESHMYG